MPLPALYISSVIDSFSTFLDRSNAAPVEKETATALLTAVLKKKNDATSWSTHDVAGFVSDHPDYLPGTIGLVTQFIERFPPHQISVYLQQFLLALANDGCSRSTIKNYRSDINQFWHFAQTNQLSQLLNKTVMAKFVANEQAKGLQVSSIRRKVAAISQFGLWSQRQRLVENKLDWMANPRLLEELNPSINHSNTSTGQQRSASSVNHQAAAPISVTSPAVVAASVSKTTDNHTTENNTASHRLNIQNPNALEGRPVLDDRQGQPEKSLDRLGQKIRQQTQNLISPWLTFAAIGLFFIGLSIFGYQQLLSETSRPLAYPTSPVAPNRVLSFQGRLTDTAQNPITVATNMTFKLFDASTSGVELWNSGVCSVTPDQDGIFNTALGSTCGSSIPASVFSERANVWLEVTIASETLSPRQPIWTVPYALNSETLQGYPINATGSATVNTVLTMDASGDVVLGEVGPEIRSVSGQFSLTGQSLLLQTQNNGDIILDANGTGGTFVRDYFSAPAATLSATYAGGTPLTLRGGPSGTANLLSLQNNAGSVQSVFDEVGYLGIGTTNPGYALQVVVPATGYQEIVNFHSSSSTNAVGISVTNSSNSVALMRAYGPGAPGVLANAAGFFATSPSDAMFMAGDGIPLYFWGSGSGYNSPAMTINTSDNVGIGDTTPASKFTVGNGDLFQINSSGAIIAATGITSSGTITFSGLNVAGGVVYTDGSGVLGSVAGTLGQCLVSNGTSAPSWGACAAGATNFWRLNNGALSPVNDTTDLLIGSQASTSAKFAFLNVNSGTPTASIAGTTTGAALTMTGEGTIATTRNRSLLLNPNGGNVGIGTTSPTAKLDVNGSFAFYPNSFNSESSLVSRSIHSDGRWALDIKANNASAARQAIAVYNQDVQFGYGGEGNVLGGVLGANTSGYAYIPRLRISNSSGGPNNASALLIDRSSSTEWLTGGSYPSGSNYYQITTFLGAPLSAVRAPLRIGGYDLSFWTGESDTRRMTIATAGNVGIGTSSPTALLHVSGSYGANDALTINQLNSANILTASASGTTRFTLANDGSIVATGPISGLTGVTSSGTITFSGLNVAGGVVYTDGSGVLGSVAGTLGQCLVSNGTSAPSWGACAAGATNFWRLNNGALSPVNDTTDLLIGSQASTSAKFAFLNVNSGTPTASIAGTTTGAALTMTGEGTIATTNNRSLLLNPTGGNVGIGTTTPITQLDLGSLGSGLSFGNSLDSLVNASLGALALQARSSLYFNIDSNNSDTDSSNNAAFIVGKNGTGAVGGSATEMFRINENGNVGIGTTNPVDGIHLGTSKHIRFAGTYGPSGDVRLTESGGAISIGATSVTPEFRLLPFGNDVWFQNTYSSGGMQFSGNSGGDLLGNVIFRVVGNVGIGATSPTAKLHVSGAPGAGGNALAIFNQTGSSDILTASASGTTRFTVANNGSIVATGPISGLTGVTSSGTITFSGLNVAGGVVYTDGSGVLASVAGSSSQCLISNGTSAPSWGACDDPAKASKWNISNGAYSQINTTADLLIGGTASTSAKFAFLNVNSGTPTASIAGTTTGAALTMTGEGTIATTRNRSLVLNPDGGFVGIGTTAPATALEIAGANGGSVRLFNDTVNGRITQISRSASTTTILGLRTDIVLDAWQNSGDRYVRVQNSGGFAAHLTVTGNVGIGTTTPGSALAIGSTSQFQINSSGAITAATGITSSGTITLSGLNVAGGVVYTNGSGVLASVAGSSGECLLSNGTSAPSWGACSTGSANYWRLNNGAFSPVNDTADLLIGGTASTSAKFAFLNVNSGTPTASIAGTTTGAALTMTGEGTIATTNNRSLLLNPTGGNIGIGTSNPISKFDIFSSTTNSDVQRWMASDGSRLGRFTETSGGAGWFEVDNASGVAQWLLRGDGGASYLASGNFGLGTTAPTATLDVAGDASTSGSLVFRGSSPATIDVLNGSRLDIATSPGGDADLSSKFTILSNGNVGIGTTNPGYKLAVTGGATSLASGQWLNFGNAAILYGDGTTTTLDSPNASGILKFQTAGTERARVNNIGNFAIGTTSPTAKLHVAGNFSNNDALTVNQLNSGNIFTASASGTTRFTLANNGSIVATGPISGLTGVTSSGTITFSGLNVAGGVVYTDGSGVLASVAGSSGECLLSNGTSAPSWGSCAAGATNFWRLNNGAFSPVNDTTDLLIGSQASTSAKFAFLNVNSGTPTASIAGTTTGAALTMTGEGTIATTNNRSLLLNPTGGNVGIGTSAPSSKLSLFVGASTGSQLSWQRNTSETVFDLYQDSSSAFTIRANGTNRFIFDGNGRLGIGASPGSYPLLVSGGGSAGTARFEQANTSGIAVQVRGASGQTANLQEWRNFSDVPLASVTAAGGAYFGSSVGIGTSSPTASLLVNGTFGANDALTVNQLNSGNILTASASGTTRFTLENTGNIVATGTLTGLTGLTSSGTITFSGLTTNGGLLYTNGSGVVAQTAAGSLGECLISSGGGSPTWGSCSAGSSPNYWRLTNGALSPVNDTLDFLVGADATTSAKFAVLNVDAARGNQVASISGNIVLDSAGTIETTKDQTLTLGGTSTGNIIINPTSAAWLGIGTTTPVTNVTVVGGMNSSGGALSFNNNSNFAVDIATGTSTGTVSIGTGASTQTISIANGAGAKTFNLGSNNTTSTTNLLSGSGGINMNVSTNQPVNIATGTSTGLVTVGGTGTQTISIGNGAGIKTVNLGSSTTSSTTTLRSGSGGINLNVSVNSSVNIGTGTSTGNITLGGTGSQTISLGNGAANKTVNLGSSNTTSTTTILSGSNGVNINANNNQPTNIGTGTTTGTVTIGGTGTQTIALGNGAGVKTVNLGSNNTTSTTTILSGSGGLNLNVNNNQPTNIGTGTTTGTVSLGGNANQVAINSSTWDIDGAGVATGLTGITSSGTITFSGLNVAGGVVYTNGSGVLASVAGTTGQCLTSNGTSAPSWGNCDSLANASKWNISNGAYSQINTTADLLIGGTASTSAKFAFLNVNTGTPTASISGSTTGAALTLTGEGTIATTRNRSLILNPTGGNVGIGTTTPNNKLTVAGTFLVDGSAADVSVDSSGNFYALGSAVIGSGGGLDGTLRVNESNAGRVKLNINNDNSAGGGSRSTQLAFMANGANRFTIGSDWFTNNTKDLYFEDGSAAGGGLRMYIDPYGRIGMGGITSLISTLQLQRNSGGNATLLINELGSGDLMTASASGTTRFRIDNSGQVYAAKFFDSANNSFFLDPAASGNGLVLAGDISLDSGGTIASTGNNNVIIDAGSGTVLIGATGTGKLDAGTIDPPYWIDGVGYATYAPSMIGLKEEMSEVVTLQPSSVPGVYKYEINFADLNRETQMNLWLYSRIIDLDQAMNNLGVLVSARGDAKVAYKKDPAARKVILYGDTPTEVTFRLTAPRYDHTNHGTKRTNQDGRGMQPTTSNQTTTGSTITDQDLATALDTAPAWTLSNLGQLNLIQVNQQVYQVATPQGTPLTALAGYAQAVIGTLRAGFISTQELVAARLTATEQVQTPVVQTDLISPLTGKDLTIGLSSTKNGQTAGELQIRNDQQQVVAKVDGNGNATLAGQLLAQEVTAASVSATALDATSARIAQLEANMAELEQVRATTAEIVTATISGTLYADDIFAFQEKVATALQEPSLLSQILGQVPQASASTSLATLNHITDDLPLMASGSGSLNKSLADLELGQEDVVLGSAALFVNTYFELNGSGYIANSLGVGNSLLVGEGTSITDGVYEYISSTDPSATKLQIQPSGRGSINFLAGLMTLSDNGQVTIAGDLEVAGNVKTETLLTNLITATDFTNPLQVQVAQAATDSAEVRESRFEIINELGTPVATISAQGRAAFAGGLAIGSEDISGSNEPSTTKTSGKSKVLAGTDQVTIKASSLTANSLVYVTPVGSTGNQVLYVKSQTADNPETPENESQFVVGFDTSATLDVQFNWWIIN